MAFHESLALRLRQALAGEKNITERKMFGGLCFMLNSNMVGGVLKNDLVVKIGKKAHEKLGNAKHTRPFDFSGKPMLGILYVAPEGLKTKKDLQKWLALGLAHAKSLPAKIKK